MSTNWIIIVALASIGLVILLILAGQRIGTGSLPLVPRRLMTERERRVIEMIEAAAPGCRVHAQVAMGALLDAKAGMNRKQRTTIRNGFDRKIVDYVIENKQTGDVVAIVELDDRTHIAAKDKARDRLTAAAGYTTVRLPAGEGVTHQVVRERLTCARQLGEV